MKINLRFLVFLLIISSLIAVSYNSRPDAQPILRASISKIRNYLTVPNQEPSYLKILNEKLVTKPFQKIDEEVIETKQQVKKLEHMMQQHEKTELNLSLPKEWEAYEWKKPAYYSSYPNFFVPKERNTRFGVSGALHLDESDDAYEGPIEKSILGAEVELKWKLP